MKPMHILMLATFALIAPTISHAQVAGKTIVGVSVEELYAEVLRREAEGLDALAEQKGKLF